MTQIEIPPFEPRLEYEATASFDGEIKGRVSSYSLVGLEEQLHKFTRLESAYTKGDFDDDNQECRD